MIRKTAWLHGTNNFTTTPRLQVTGYGLRVTGYGLQGTGARRVFRSWELGVRVFRKRCAAKCETPDAGYELQRVRKSVDVCNLHGPRTTDQKFGSSDGVFIDPCSLIFERSAGANEIIYCGYRYDPEGPGYYVRNRNYIPFLGRWLQRDPIGYAGGINLYEYVEGWPTMGLDPIGLLMGFPAPTLCSTPPGCTSNAKCCQCMVFQEVTGGCEDAVYHAMLNRQALSGHWPKLSVRLGNCSWVHVPGCKLAFLKCKRSPVPVGHR